MVCRSIITALGILLLTQPAAVLRCDAQDPSPIQNANPWNAELANKAQALFRELPEVRLHDQSTTNAFAAKGFRAPELHEKLLREKLEGRWFAALVHTGDQASLGIYGRFETWRGFVEFLAERGALVDLWAQGEKGVKRRIPAAEIARLKRQDHEPPTTVTVTFHDERTGNR
jgi:hypothetical protein